MDIERAADLYAKGWTLRQIGAELGLTASKVSDRILELRDQGLTWSEVAKQVDMTVSGVWSRYRRARPPKRPRLGRW